MYIYPDNLKSKAILWLWELKDIAIIGVATLLSVVALVQLRFIPTILLTAVYAFLTIRFDDMSILEFIKNAWAFFIGTRQEYEWRYGSE